MKNKIFDILILGSGLSSMIFAEEYLKKNKKIDIISPRLKNTKKIFSEKIDINLKSLPPQFKKNFKKIYDYFIYNKIIFNKENCNLLGSLEFGGLSNYWGLQIDKTIENELNEFNKVVRNKISQCFKELFKEKKLIGEYEDYKNNFQLSSSYENFFYREKNDSHFLEKPVIALSKKKKNININKINNNFSKLVPSMIAKNKIVFHNYVVEKITKDKNTILLHTKNNKSNKIFKTKKLIMGCGTLVTTKLLIDFLNIKNEIPIKHHPRLISVYFARKKLDSRLDFTPGLIQVKKIKNNNYVGDIRPANEMIIDMSLKIYTLLSPLKKLFLFFKDYLIFSNTLLSSKSSNLFIKKHKDYFKVYSKKKPTLNALESSQKKIFNFLKTKKIILPIYKNFFPGVGADYHYFGTIKTNKKSPISINNNCQLRKSKSIFIIDGSSLNFKNNFYPLGIIMANAKRIAKLLNK